MTKDNPLILYHATMEINIYETILYIAKFLRNVKKSQKMYKYLPLLRVLKKLQTVQKDHGNVMTISS